jgi:hypothetical protein
MLATAANQDLILAWCQVFTLEVSSAFSIYVLFFSNNFDKVRYFKWLLACYENLYGLKINYKKSDMMSIGLKEDEKQSLVSSGSKLAPMVAVAKALGVPRQWRVLVKECLQALEV